MCWQGGKPGSQSLGSKASCSAGVLPANAAGLVDEDGQPAPIFHDLRRTASATWFEQEFQSALRWRFPVIRRAQSLTDTISPARLALRRQPYGWMNKSGRSRIWILWMVWAHLRAHQKGVTKLRNDLAKISR